MNPRNRRAARQWTSSKLTSPTILHKSSHLSIVPLTSEGYRRLPGWPGDVNFLFFPGLQIRGIGAEDLADGLADRLLRGLAVHRLAGLASPDQPPGAGVDEVDQQSPPGEGQDADTRAAHPDGPQVVPPLVGLDHPLLIHRDANGDVQVRRAPL